MIKAVFIDIDNTLLDFNKCALWSMKKSFEDYNLNFKEQMFDTFNLVNNRLWLEIEKGKLTKEELYACRWNMIFAILGIDVDGVQFENVFYSYLTESAEPVDGALETLKYLSGKYIVCVKCTTTFANAKFPKNGTAENKSHIATSIPSKILILLANKARKKPFPLIYSARSTS